MLGEVGLDTIFLAAAEGWIGKNDINTIRLRIADVRSRQCVVVTDEGRIVDVVEQHVGNAEHVRQLLFLRSAERLLHLLLVGRRLHVPFAHMADGTG
jgi:hypothetical protein